MCGTLCHALPKLTLYMNCNIFKNTILSALLLASVFSANAEDSLFDGYTLNPAPGEVTQINEILVNFPNMGDNKFTWNRGSMITLTNGETSYMGSVLGYGTQRAINFIDLSDPMNPVAVNVTIPGEWTLTIPAGTFQSGSEKNSLINAVYTIVEEAGPSYTATPESGEQMDFPVPPMVQRYIFDFGDADVSAMHFNEEATAVCTYNSRTVSRVANTSSQTGYNIDFPQPGKMVVEVNPQVFTLTGEFHLTLEEGYFTVDGKGSPAIDYSLYYGEKSSARMIVTPTPESETSEMSHFVISFPDSKNVRVSEWANANITGPQSYSVFTLTEIEDADFPSFALDFSPSPTYPGNYTLFIDKGSFIIDDIYENEELRAHYKFVKENVDTSWQPSPNTGNVLNSNGNISVAIVFAEDELVTKGASFNSGVHLSINGNDVPAADFNTEFFQNNFMVNVNGEKYRNTEGTLKLTVDAGALYISEIPCEAISQSWNIMMEDDIQPVFSPASGSTVASLENITVSFPEAETGSYFPQSKIQLRAADYSGYMATATVREIENTEYPVFELTFNPAPENNGEYILSMGYGCFFFNNVQSSEPVEINYRLDKASGITGIDTDSDSVTVISVDGKTLLHDAPAERLKTLAPGLYIINGNKVIIR